MAYFTSNKWRFKFMIESLLLLWMYSHHCTSSFQLASRAFRGRPLFAESTASAEARSTYLATCIPGLSGVLAQELKEFGCRDIVETASSAVLFSASLKEALTTLLWSRTTHKLSERLVASDSNIQNRDDLHTFIRRTVLVKDLLGDGKGGLLTLSVSVTLNQPGKIPSDIRHSHYSALTVKNALCDSVRELRGDRPDVDLLDPDVPLSAVLLGTDTGAQVSLYRQLHAGSLHRRGYRTAMHKASLKESLAAGLLLNAGWKEKCSSAIKGGPPAILVDPMSGSGSLPLEAAMIAADLAPGLMRIRCEVPGQNMPAVVRWKHKNDTVSLWKELLLDAAARAKNGMQSIRSTESVQIVGNDLHPGALDLFEDALDVAGLGQLVAINEGDCRDWEPDIQGDPEAPWFIVTNPPWGVRLTEDMHESWESLRYFLREVAPPGTEAYVLSGNPSATKHLGLRRSQSFPIKTGELDLRWIQYVIRRKGEAVPGAVPEPSTTETPVDVRRPPVPTFRIISDKENEWLN